MNLSLYIVFPRQDVFSELEKQGDMDIGFGVGSTKVLTTNPDTVRTQFRACIDQVRPIMEVEPVKKKQKAREEVVKKSVSPLIDQWYSQCMADLESGCVGLVPECYQQTGLPDKAELLSSGVGDVLRNFCLFIKKLF
jgi:hypothetical protein